MYIKLNCCLLLSTSNDSIRYMHELLSCRCAVHKGRILRECPKPVQCFYSEMFHPSYVLQQYYNDTSFPRVCYIDLRRLASALAL